MQTPMNKQWLSLPLGIINHLFYYMPKYFLLNFPSEGYLKKGVLFQSSEAHDVAFKKIKNHMTESVCYIGIW